MLKKAVVFLLLSAVLLLPIQHAAAAFEKTYYFVCKHQSEGLSGLSGPSRLTYQMAQQDEESHLKAHPDHKGSTTIITNQ
jgi:hypothetical protein